MSLIQQCMHRLNFKCQHAKYILLFTVIVCFCIPVQGQLQTAAGYIPSNRSMSGSLEKNILFNAPTRYKVTQSGMEAYSSAEIAGLFDGSMAPNYTWNKPVTSSNPLVIIIEGLPAAHTQVGGWVGFSTRYWPASKFKIEGYNEYAGANTWVVLADVTGNTEPQYAASVVNNSGAFTKLRFTFYEGCSSSSSPAGQMGLSELFFIHPEAAQAYDGLFLKADVNQNTGFGTTRVPPGYKVAIDGKLIVEEVTVMMSEQWPDYVFAPEYKLRTLGEIEQFVKDKQHLPDVPSAEAVAKDGVNLGEMNAILLKKVEELTLHLIEMSKENAIQRNENALQRKEIDLLMHEIASLKK